MHNRTGPSVSCNASLDANACELPAAAQQRNRGAGGAKHHTWARWADTRRHPPDPQHRIHTMIVNWVATLIQSARRAIRLR